ASNSRSVIFPMNRAAHSLNAAFETTSTPPVVRTKSSTTNRSIAFGSRAFQTAAQNSSTTLTESLSLIFALLVVPSRIRPARRPRSEGRNDPGAAIFVEPLEETLDCVRVPRETGPADLAERQHDVVLDREHELEEAPVHQRPEIGLGEPIFRRDLLPVRSQLRHEGSARAPPPSSPGRDTRRRTGRSRRRPKPVADGPAPGRAGLRRWPGRRRGRCRRTS